MKLTDILTESKSFDEFAEKRMGGASKIANNAKEKGGLLVELNQIHIYWSWGNNSVTT